MKRILYLLIVTLLAVSCSKKDDDPETITFNPLPLLTEYNVDNVFKDNSGVSFQNFNDNTFICFSGQLKENEEIGLFIFNRNTKTKLAGIVPLKEPTVTFNKPYGEKETVIINHYKIDSFLDNGTIVLALSINDHTNYPRYFCFIKEGKLIKTTTISNTFSISNPQIEKWRENFIIKDSSTGIDPNVSESKVVLYSPTGEKILDVVNSAGFKYMPYSEILNNYEGIYIDYYPSLNYPFIPGLKIERFDLRKRKEYPIWLTPLDISKLDRPQINNRKAISKTDTHFTYELSYTEYSGTKGTIKFKVNIETGEIEYL